MDERAQLQGVAVVWNAEKATRNVRRHGISFEEGIQAFFDPFLRVIDASREGERRDAVLGMDEAWRLLFVVHIQVEGEEIRVISARRATREEWRIYEI